jgi:hypothetical protein
VISLTLQPLNTLTDIHRYSLDRLSVPHSRSGHWSREECLLLPVIEPKLVAISAELSWLLYWFMHLYCDHTDGFSFLGPVLNRVLVLRGPIMTEQM